MFSPDWLRETAVRVGYVQRNRKIDPVTFLGVVVLGFGVGVQLTLASLRRTYETALAETLVPSSFYYRFNKGLVAFLKECLAQGIADLTSHVSLTLSECGFCSRRKAPALPLCAGPSRFALSPRL